MPRRLNVPLSDKIEEILRDLILKGDLRPGERIVESQIAREMQVSQVSVREALWSLENQGFVTRIPNKGAIVTMLSPENVQQIYRLRALLEGFAAELACKLATPADLDKLSDLARSMVKFARKGDFRGFQAIDYEFHQTVWHLSHDTYLERVLHNICQPLFSRVLIGTVFDVPAEILAVARMHQSIANRIRTGRGKAANRLVQHAMRDWSRVVAEKMELVPEGRSKLGQLLRLEAKGRKTLSRLPKKSRVVLI